MSRFDTDRAGRILAWTGAALAWGTAVTIAALEPDSAETDGRAPAATSAVAPASQVAAMPTPPADGLVILRYQPSTSSTPDVRTVYVQQKAVAAPNPAPAAQPAPAPQSSGS